MGPRYGPSVIVVQTRYGTRSLLPPTTPPPGKLEQVAGLLVHQAARTDTGKASRLLACSHKVTGKDDQDLRAPQSELGRLARQSPVPEVVTQTLALVETHPHIRTADAAPVRTCGSAGVPLRRAEGPALTGAAARPCRDEPAH